MKRTGTVALDATAIAGRIAELGMKRWTLASAVGVTEKTLSRWINGRVRRADRRNALSLADALGVPFTTIALRDPDAPTPGDRARTAQMILDKGLMRLAGPSGAWGLAGEIVRSALDPSLPEGTQARLRVLLAITLWRTGRLDEARECGLRVMEYACRTGDREVRARILVALGTISTLRGEKKKACELLEEGIARREDFQDEADWASGVNNLGMERKDQARFSDAIALFDQAIDVYARRELPFNRAIALNARAQARVEIGRFREAVRDFDAALEASVDAAYTEGKVTLPLLKLDALSLTGETVMIPLEYCTDTVGPSDLGGDCVCCESLARLLRRSGDPAAGLRLCDRTLRDAPSSEPVERALISLEKSRALHSLGRPQDSRRECERANAAFRALDLPGRECRWPVPEHGSVFQ